MGASDSSSIPNWLQGATTPGVGFRRLLKRLHDEFNAAPQNEKIDAFRDGIEAIRQHVGWLTISLEMVATYPGGSVEDIVIFAGQQDLGLTPVIAFDTLGRVWTGSLEASMGTMTDGRAVFNAFRANRVC